MTFWQRVKNWAKKTFSRKPSKSPTRSGGRARTSTTTTRVARNERSSASSVRRALIEQNRKEREEKKKKKEREKAYEVKTFSGSGGVEKGRELASNLKQEKERRARREMLDSLKEKRSGGESRERTYVNARGDKVLVPKSKSKRAQALVGGTKASDMEYRMDVSPKSQSFIRGVESGLTLGASELGAKHSSKRNADTKKAEKIYQEKKSKGWETAGEVAGSLVTFGGTAGATEKIGTKVVGKVAPKAAEKLATKKLIQRSAKKAVEKQVKKGTVREASEELIRQVGKDKAKKVVNAIGADVAQNLTTGAIYDINKASARHEVGSKEWWKEIRESAAINFGVTGAIAGGSALSGGERLVKEGVEKIANRRLARRVLNPSAKADVQRTISNAVGGNTAVNRLRRGVGKAELPPVKGRQAVDGTPILASESDTKTVVSKVTNKKPKGKSEKLLKKLRAEKEELAKEYETAKREGGDTEGILADMQETDMRIRDIENGKGTSTESRQVTLDDVAEATAKETESKQMTLDDAIKQVEKERSAKAGDKTLPPKEEPKTEKAKTPKQKKKEEANEREAFDKVMRENEKTLDADVRRETKGEYGYRQGEHTAAAHSSMEQATRMKKEQDAVAKSLKDDEFEEMFNDDTLFGVFKTANKTERRAVAEKATSRVDSDLKGSAKRLLKRAEALEKDLKDTSAMTSAEHITIDDIADIVAIRNKFDAAGVPIPEKYDKAFARIIEWQRTEAAQLLKSVDLFLKENDEAYRRAFISRDVNRYLKKVIGADDVAIADIKRSLDANNGKGYFDKMVDALAKFGGSANEAEFRKAYADFQAELFMNTKPTVWDAVNLWRHSFMLSSPKTGANNILGNVMQRVMYNIADLGTMVGEKALASKGVQRTTALLKSKDQRRLAKMFTSGKLGESNLKKANYLKDFDDQAFADAINTVADADVGEMMRSSKYMGDVVKGLQYKPTTAQGKIKQGIVKGGAAGNKYVSLMLNEPDSWFVERNYRSALLKYLEANEINSSKALNTKEGEKLLKDARAHAKEVALENTYKKANNLVSFLEGIRTKGHRKGANAGYKAGAILLDAEMPYLKVPVNLVVNNFKYSPLGALKGATDAFRAIGKGDTAMLNKATAELSKGLTGTGLMMLGYMMYCQDQADDGSSGFIGNAKDELKEYGIRDNSFKIGNRVFNISNMGIGSVQLLMGASLAEDLAEQGKTPPHQVVMDAISKNVDTVADMSLMENAVSLLDAFGNSGDYDMPVSERLGRASMEVAGDYAAQFVPNPARGVAKGMTEADLDTGVKKGDTTQLERILERNKNNFVQGVPVLNEKALPHKVDTHGNLVNERKTGKDKALAILNNTLNPLTARKVDVPEVDKEEMKVLKDNGEAFKPKGFDKDREYKSRVGAGKYAEEINLTGKEREQVARAAKRAGYDIATALVRKGMFGDRLGDRAQGILNNIPDDEEKAREMIFSTPEWKNADNDTKKKWLDAIYGEGAGNNNKGVKRTRNEEAYVNVAGNSEGDFRFQNDVNWQTQKKYYDNNFEELGIDKGTFADVVASVYDASHKWDEENGKNVDTPNSARKVKAGILAVEGLTPEQRIAIYQAYRGKRNGFGWYDWDGVSGGGYYRRGYRRWRRRRRGGSSKMPTPKLQNAASAYKVKAFKGSSDTRTTSSRGTTSLAAMLKNIQDTEAKVKPPTPKGARK